MQGTQIENVSKARQQTIEENTPIEDVHDLITDDNRFVLVGAMSRKIIDNLTKDAEVPHEAPGILVWDDEISRVKLRRNSHSGSEPVDVHMNESTYSKVSVHL
jgi:hypothetical protein